MSRPKEKKNLTSVSKVLSKLVSSLNLDKRLKEHTLMSLWPQLIGDVLASRSRPLFIDNEGVIVIAAREAAVAQELSLIKPQILKSLKGAGEGLGLSITGMRFDLKHFHSLEREEEEARKLASGNISSGAIRPPQDEELKEITLDAADLSELANLRENLTIACGEGKDGFDVSDRIMLMYERELRMKRWLHNVGAPNCSYCASATPRLHGPDGLCSACFYASAS